MEKWRNNNFLGDTDKGQSENIALPCITPNNNAGWCVELEQCELLKNKVIQNRGIITQFIKNSACDKDNQNLFCCGKYDDYIPYPGQYAIRHFILLQKHDFCITAIWEILSELYNQVLNNSANYVSVLIQSLLKCCLNLTVY